jgi:uncharacterized protein (DUF433 family)
MAAAPRETAELLMTAPALSSAPCPTRSGLREAPGGSERRTIPDMAFERITIDPARMGGVPCLRDLRVTVSMVLGQLAAGRSIEELLQDYPYLEREDVTAALEYAAAIVNEREMPINRPA